MTFITLLYKEAQQELPGRIKERFSVSPGAYAHFVGPLICLFGLSRNIIEAG